MKRSDESKLVTRPRKRRGKRSAASVAVLAVVGTLFAPLVTSPAQAAPVGQGFNLNASDVRFILKQIQISENHVANTNSTTGPCGGLLGPGANQIPNNGVGVTLPWGLRTVSGVCNNIDGDQNDFGQADRPFPRLVGKKLRAAESGDPDGPGPAQPVATSYQQTSGTVVDSEPREVSNLIVDQTAGNPAAVAAAGENPQVDARTGSLFIPNVATDTGLSAPYNSWFTLFGQFFDHGLDLVNKGGNGSVMIPLKPGDPKYVAGSPTNFMMLTRATQSAGEATNQTSPFVDQSQTYTSHPSHQVFLREYTLRAGKPVGTGKLLTGPGGGMANWAAVKAAAATNLGIGLVDTDVTSVPLLKTDAYGRFERGPGGFPLLVLPGADGVVGNADDGVREGNPTTPVSTVGAAKTGHAFLDDIAHHAVPTGDIDPTNGPNQIVDLEPDADPGTTDDGSRATYDNEMLDAHFIAGDGRVNENIGLTAVHHVFHSEHNRLTGDIADIIAAEPAANQAAWNAVGPSGWEYEERLFQAARFVTEMEYQHLAFEEFARKVQPMVNLFGEGGTGYHSDINPAIRAEFAHAVYRFGHSMLNETVDRTTAAGAKRNIALLDAFLNPPKFLEGGLAPDVAAGEIVRGMTRQVGNELDEFTTDALRNDLLGLPLDLATLNMARAREQGIPTLNEARRKFYADTSDSALKPYSSWADLKFSLKHEESLVNFIAAYGTHDSIEAATTRATKRAAAEALLADASDPDPAVSEDAYNFLNSVGAYENGAGGVTTTGVDDIDLWVGGLAEKQHVFGGLLGPTFNYVFEGQMEDLQDGDRMYYLSRTAGLNLLTQLEGNSFSELIQRNTDVTSLPADSFSRPDFVYDVAALGTSGAIPDDPTTEDWTENTQLTRSPDGTIRYGGPAHVVFNGSDRNDKLHSSEGDDTMRGNDGDDRMEGGDGADNLIGGLGDDIMTDLFGDDVLKGGDGNDALSSGRGFAGDLNQSGRGKDFVVGGNDTTETFAGPGDDFVFAGDAEDTVFGDDGNDWIEGGKGPFNLLQGDNGAPFQDDPNEAGHDVMFSYGGEQDYDGEGGDDVMLLGPGIQRAEGMLGFDWTSHKSDPVAGDSDMDITGLLPPSVDTNRDRHDLVEALSGWDKNDTLRGDSRAAADLGTEHTLTNEGIDRVTGLRALLPAGTTSFNAGNIITGGSGSDLIEGRGGDDIINGDAWLNIRLSVRTNPADPATEIGSADTMRAPYLTGSTTTLQDAVFAGTVNPGNIVIVREMLSTPAATDVDTALFSGPSTEYDITSSAAGVQVAHTGGLATNGTDTLRGVEQLRFDNGTPVTTDDETVTIAAPAAPTIGAATAGNAQATVRWTAPAANGSPVTGYEITATPAAGTPIVRGGFAATATTATFTGLTNGTSYTFQVRALNRFGPGALSAASNAVTPAAVAPAPALTTRAPGVGATGVAVGANVTGTFNVDMLRAGFTAGTAAAPGTVVLRNNATNAFVASAVTTTPLAVATNTRNFTLNPTADLAAGTTYRVTLSAGTATTGIRSSTGAPLAAPITWTFTTAAPNPPPTVTARTPGINAIGVARANNITATFSEPVVAAGVNATTVFIRRVAAPTVAIAAPVTYNATTRVATLNPNVNLLANTQYRVTLTGGATAIRDLAGAPLVTTSWTFTTGP
ncbi:MAG TPA: peroxidase family protein [Nocardioidaceae bacterium]|nr:peroxidase family protein [Nocardioidaceae bacterium]